MRPPAQLPDRVRRLRRHALLDGDGEARLVGLVRPAAEDLLEHVERDRAVPQDGVVELADVELLAEFRLGLAAEFADPQLAELVGRRQPGSQIEWIAAHRRAIIGFAHA